MKKISIHRAQSAFENYEISQITTALRKVAQRNDFRYTYIHIHYASAIFVYVLV